MVEWAGILSNEFGAKNYPVPTRRAPNFLLKVVSYFDTSVQQVRPVFVTTCVSVKTSFNK